MPVNKLAILWDMDGTMIDTRDCHFQTWQRALEYFGFNLDKSVYQQNFGRNNDVLLPLLLGFEPDAAVKQSIIKKKEGLFREMAPGAVSLVPGLADWLSTARDWQLKQAVASSASIENITVMLSHYQLETYFDAVVSGDDLPAKPAPDVFLKAAKQVGTNPANCLVIEDSPAGIRAAKNAGMRCVAVGTYHSESVFLDTDAVVEDFRQPLAAVLDQIGLSMP